tara:strand:+ start:967 stop:1230 length:264 start_codon:yes stop_codon:yes gene_type:complete
MLSKIKILVYLFSIISLISYTFIVYFSDDVVLKINKNRANYSNQISENLSGLPLLKNDTNNIINYNIEKNSEKKIKKRYFWDLLKDE